MKRIMLVDYSPYMLMSMENVLTRVNHTVDKASSGEAAIGMLQAGAKPNLMITDLNMGAMSGIDLIRETRKLPAGRFMPILMLTTESSQDKRAEAEAAGATDWLMKPVAPDALLEVVK